MRSSDKISNDTAKKVSDLVYNNDPLLSEIDFYRDIHFVKSQHSNIYCARATAIDTSQYSISHDEKYFYLSVAGFWSHQQTPHEIEKRYEMADPNCFENMAGFIRTLEKALWNKNLEIQNLKNEIMVLKNELGKK